MEPGPPAVTTAVRRFDRLELAHAIEALYAAFSPYSPGNPIDVCPHCNLDAAERVLRERPLRELTWSDLGPYCPRALTAFGNGSDLRYFLPRILELYVGDHRGAPCGLFVTFGKLERADWTNWPEAERAAIGAFVDAWRRVLAGEARESEDAAWQFEELRLAAFAL
jgi:hypothetical protein